MSKSAIAKWNAAITRASSPPKPLRMKDHPRIQLLEQKLLLWSHPGRPNSPELDTLIDEVSVELFGVTQNQTLFPLPADYEYLPVEQRWVIDDQYDAHEKPYDPVEDVPPEEAAAVLARYGMDFLAEPGQPLRCTKILARQAIAGAKGIMGRMPDPADFRAKGFENWLQKEADAFQSRRRKG